MINYVLETKDADKKMARYYLEGNEWDANLAEKEYKEDLEWEKK